MLPGRMLKREVLPCLCLNLPGDWSQSGRNRVGHADIGDDIGKVQPPDLRFGLLHQKLQMLNLCIAQRKSLKTDRSTPRQKVNILQSAVCRHGYA